MEVPLLPEEETATAPPSPIFDHPTSPEVIMPSVPVKPEFVEQEFVEQDNDDLAIELILRRVESWPREDPCGRGDPLLPPPAKIKVKKKREPAPHVPRALAKLASFVTPHP